MQFSFSLRGLAAAAVLALAACAQADSPTAAVPTPAGPARSGAYASITVTNSGGHPLVSWGAVPGAVSYRVDLILHKFSNGRYYGRSVSTLTTTTATSYLDTGNDYTGVYQCPTGSFMAGSWYEYGVTTRFADGTSTQSRAYAPIAGGGATC